jgi:iron complex outermembrane receptor protein
MRSVLVLFLWSCTTLLWAQPPFTLQGRVLDDHDATPMSFAEVFLPELQRGTVADAEGRFVLEGLPVGTYRMRVSHVGCETVERRVTVDRNVQVLVRMEHHAEELRELEVIAERPDENVGMSVAEVDRAAMERASGRNLAELLSGIPGVTMLSSGPTIGKPVIHGLHGNRVLVMNQGVRQEDQQWGSEHAPNLDPLSTDRITVVKGAASVQYGADAIGGVVVTEPVALPVRTGWGGEVRGFGAWNGRGGGGNGMLQWSSPRVRGLAFRVQGSLRTLGDSESPRYVLSNTAMNEGAASASIGLQRHWGGAQVYYSYFQRELGILRASHIGNLTDLRNAVERGEPWFQAPFTRTIDAPRQTAAHHMAKGEFTFRLSDTDRLVLTYAYQADDRQEYDIRRAGRSAIPSTDLFLYTHTSDLVWKHWLGRRLHGRVGFSGMMQENFNVPGTGVRPLLPDYTRSSGGLYLVEHYPLSDRIELEVGARVEMTRLRVAKYDRENNFITPEHIFLNQAFSMGADVQLREDLRLRCDISSAYRPPHVSELYSEGLHHGAAAIEEGDEGLGSERALRGTAELQAGLFDGRLQAMVGGHAGWIDDFIYLRPDGYQLSIRGAFPRFRYVATDVFLSGMDASVTWRIVGPVSLRSRYSLVRGRDLDAGTWLFQLPADRWENSLAYALDTIGGWCGVEVAVTSQWVQRQHRFPVGVDLVDPPPAYHLLGVSMSAARPFRTGELRIGITGGNLLNTVYRDIMDRFRYFTDARGADAVAWLRWSFGNVR